MPGSRVAPVVESHSNRLSAQDLGIDALLGNSALDRPLRITVFPNLFGRQSEERVLTLRGLAAYIGATTAPTKSELPLLKLATFGTLRSPGGSLRHDANLVSIEGVEGDHDSGAMGFDEACDRIRAARRAAVVFTTPKHTPALPRWRVLIPTSVPRHPNERDALCKRLNADLGGCLAPESLTRSQAFYFGRAGESPDFRIEVIDGDAIDTGAELPIDGGPADTDGSRPANDYDEEAAAGFCAAPDWAKITNAMAAIPATDREVWLKVGMALHAGASGTEDALELWSQWSKSDAKFSARDQRKTWDGFGRGRPGPKVGLGTLFELAGRNGWKQPSADDSAPESMDETSRRALTEDGVALAFADRFSGQLVYDHTSATWFQWTGTHWRREASRLAFDWARETCREMARAKPKSAAAKALAKASAAGAVERFAQADRAFARTGDQFDCDPWLIGTPGGTVDLRTGGVRPGDPDDFITKVAAAAPISQATFNAVLDCPRWLAFLEDACGGDAGVIRFLQQWFGYNLTGVTREQALLFVYGPGGSGKGTAVNTFADVLGDYAINVDMATLTASKHDRHSTELARLKGARMARASETEQARAWAENRIKTLTGEDMITARFMRQDDFEFQPTFKLTIFGNNRPTLQSVDQAIRRRFNVLPFTHQPAVRDDTLGARLRAEASGILTWGIQGCLDWQANGLIRPAAVLDATESYFAEQDTLGQWLADQCETGPAFTCLSATLWSSWSAFAMRRGEQPAQKIFPEILVQRGFPRIKDTLGIRGRGHAGLRVRNEPDVFDEET